jgi:hypothetical protein
MLVYFLDSLAAAKVVEAVVEGSDVVGIFVTKKLLIGRYFFLADLPIGGSFVGSFGGSFVGSFFGSFVGSFVGSLVRSSLCLSVHGDGVQYDNYS